MKIRKSQLKRIIQEEQQRIDEMNASANLERAEGLYAPVADMERVENLAARLWGSITQNMVADGLDREDADEMASRVMIAMLARMLKSVGEEEIGERLRGMAL